MVEFNHGKKVLKICIPVSSLKDVNRYHKSILNILDKIEIDNCEPDLREDLNNVYELLAHLHPDKEFWIFNRDVNNTDSPTHQLLIK